MQDVLKETIKFSNEKAVLFQFNSKSKLAAYSMGIYCTLIELSDSFHTLVDSQNYTGSLSIYRSFIENYVDLRNLQLNPHYVYQLDYGSYLQEQRLLKAALNDNPYLTSISQYADEKLPSISVEIDKLKENEDYKLCYTIKDKFSRANMEAEYEGLYPTLSAESHCSLDAIFSRHFNINPITGCVDISINDKCNSEEYHFYIVNLTNYLITAGIVVANIMEGQQLDVYISKKEQLLNIL
ncbi:DUF5677 domain-containing protein [Pseudoalteromonas sp. ACER1]|uniref:DUF5677 domain-containing protein n=1 Tax=unclassified Pseudoalteromonas TaxID=194690 RepID=UPI001F2D8E72|nr:MULTISPECIES: DUF5677 domain-containing protein [unclassified Pseudoalteromonas]MCF2849448.1 DUF5677 domain-containing protein [Pseudoalteromonas sp. PAST1]MCO7213010.1 DUF5677 domain-containing protein [Pseudoalteromonas sp. ACER1]